MSSPGTWWDQPARKRKVPFGAFVVVVFVACGAGLYLTMRMSEPSKVTASSAASSSAMAAPDDPATLQPIVLAASTPAGDDIFSSRVMAFVAALEQSVKRGTPGEGEELVRSEDAFATPDVRDAIGARAATAFVEVISAAKVAARGEWQGEASSLALELAAARLDNALIVERQPYFVDSMVGFDTANGRRLVLLSGFSIVATDLYSSGDVRVRTVRLRRLDRLAWSHTLLGFVRWSRAQAVVLLDQIDEQLVNLVLPALADGAPMPMLEPDDVDSPADANTSSAEGGKGVRADVANLPGLDPDAVRELGEALRARRGLFARWNDRAKPWGRKIRVPPRLAVDVTEVERDLKGLWAHGEIEELRGLEKRLARGEVTRAYETIREAFSLSIERHEVQHRLDALRPRPKPDVVNVLVPPAQTPAIERRRDRIHVELSAYLAQLARDDLLPHVTFTLLVRYLVDPKLRAADEAYASIAAVEELARELGATDVGDVFHDHKFDDARILRAHQQVVATRGPELAAAARRVWARLFGAELAPLAGPLPR